MSSSINLAKLINLAKKTGDRLIIHDSATDSSFVILNINEYEKLVDSKQDWNNLEEVISHKNVENNQSKQDLGHFSEPIDIITPNAEPDFSALNSDFYANNVIEPKKNLVKKQVTLEEEVLPKLKKLEKEATITQKKPKLENNNVDWFSAGSILKDRYSSGNGGTAEYKKRVTKKPFYNKVHLDVGNDSVFFDEPI